MKKLLILALAFVVPCLAVDIDISTQSLTISDSDSYVVTGTTTINTITVTSGITVAGGTPQKPSTTVIKLALEAASGTIPDIPELMLDLKLEAQPDLGTVPLSTKQGLYVKSSSARICGGITIGSNE